MTDTVIDNLKLQSEMNSSINKLKETLNVALQQLKTAIDQSFILNAQNDEFRRLTAKEWEQTANSLIYYVKEKEPANLPNLLTWISMINLKF